MEDAYHRSQNKLSGNGEGEGEKKIYHNAAYKLRIIVTTVIITIIMYKKRQGWGVLEGKTNSIDGPRLTRRVDRVKGWFGFSGGRWQGRFKFDG